MGFSSFNHRPERVKEVYDAVLGLLTLVDEGWWETRVAIDGRNLGFAIGGDTGPSPVLVAHARELVRTFPEFDRRITAFLAEEGRRLRLTPDQVQQLVMEEVMLTWPDRPDDGMIYFTGLEHLGVWRCDYINRKPRGLGVDR